MSTFLWILLFGSLMSLIALIGSVTALLKESTLDNLTLKLVAFASGSLIGGALFHLLPASIAKMGNVPSVYGWFATGFLAFLFLEQVLNWHHCHKPLADHKQPITYLVLVADGLHNFIGGLAIGAAFTTDLRLGITSWLVAALHEIPQELGDFGVLIHGGWSKHSALLLNFLSALSFLVGSILAYLLSTNIDITPLIPFTAGNFLYIGAVDLIPEFNRKCGEKLNLSLTLSFLSGLGILFVGYLFISHSA